MDRLLLINDLINNVIGRYQSFKKGDFTASVTIDPSIDPSKGGADAVPTAKITDLISFDDEQDAKANDKGGASSSASIMDDFASLTFDAPPSTGMNGGVQRNLKQNPSLPLDLFSSNRPPLTTSDSQQSGMAGGAPLGQWGALQLPMNNNSSSPSVTSNNASSTPSLQAQPGHKQASASSVAPPPPTASSDPFADLSEW
jgi:ADP-ribosylation factor-binding protein GGA